MKGGLHLTLNTASCRSDLPSLMTLSRVSRLNDPSHGLTSWQLISHALSNSQTPKNFGFVGFVPKLDINR